MTHITLAPHPGKVARNDAGVNCGGITEHAARLDAALSAWRSDPGRATHHLDAALAATGDLQRALILERIETEKQTERRKK